MDNIEKLLKRINSKLCCNTLKSVEFLPYAPYLYGANDPLYLRYLEGEFPLEAGKCVSGTLYITLYSEDGSALTMVRDLIACNDAGVIDISILGSGRKEIGSAFNCNLGVEGVTSSTGFYFVLQDDGCLDPSQIVTGSIVFNYH